LIRAVISLWVRAVCRRDRARASDLIDGRSGLSLGAKCGAEYEGDEYRVGGHFHDG